MKKRSTLATLVSALAAGLLPGIASSGPPPAIEISRTAQPTSYLVEARPYQVVGFGPARFGQDVAELKALIAREYPQAARSLREDADPQTGAASLTIGIAVLAPAPLPATVHYRFGAQSGRLVAIDVEWKTDGASTAAERTALVEAAKALGSTMAGWRWPPLATTRGHLLPDGTLVVFAGKDFQNGGAEIRLFGVDVDVEPRQRTAVSAARPAEHRAAPPGPSLLRLRLVAQVDQPDPYRLPDGAF